MEIRSFCTVRYIILYYTSASYNNERKKYNTNVVTVYGRHTYHFFGMQEKLHPARLQDETAELCT